ncbi:MAG: hypothetical protein KBE65_15045 [Phycisphaerae bacterium]|nr:hypothetical protein [Phycisphaerae bacterium]
MGAIVLNWIVRVLSLAWLTGPIFDKELRVSSRRRRNYVLRFLYIGLFTLLLADLGGGGAVSQYIGLPEFPHGPGRAGHRRHGPVVRVHRGPGHCHRHAQHLDQR